MTNGGLTVDVRIAARRARVKALMARRLTASEMAEVLGVSVRTIEYDMKAVRQDLAEYLATRDAIAVGCDITARSEVRQRELWALLAALQAADTATIASKVTILRELRAEADHETAQLQQLGIVYQTPREVLVSIAAVAALRKVPEEKLGEMAAASQPEFLRMLSVYAGQAAVSALIDGPERDEIE